MAGVREPIPGVVYPPVERLLRYVAAGELEEVSLVEALIASFRANHDRVALWTGQGDMTYGELDEITDRLAGALIRLGLAPLSPVLFQMVNTREIVFALIACLKAGLLPVCTLAAHREREIGFIGAHVGARAAFVDGDNPRFDHVAFMQAMRTEVSTLGPIIVARGTSDGAHGLEALIDGITREEAARLVAAVPRDPYQVALFQLSGGTTSVSKVIPRMQNDFLLNARRTVSTLGFVSDDVMFNPMPIIHNACMICFLFPTLLIGATFTIADDMTPESWERLFLAKQPTWVGLIRALFPRFEAMLAIGRVDIRHVRAFWSPDGSRMMRATYGLPSYAMFGMSEGMNMYTRPGDPDEAMDWTVGRPMSPCDEVRIVKPGTNVEAAEDEIGELTCRGPYTIAGYFDAPERNATAFDEQGYYHTGDLVERRRICGETYYAFAGRGNDVVNRGMEKINCEEVEAAVSTHGAIAECAVVGVPDPVLGERACACLVLRAGFPAPDIQGLGQHLGGLGFAKYKWPERIEVVEALPLTKVGKIDKAALREIINSALVAP